ncbi:MAG: LptF/LptG family permease [Gemmatimonadetes bacterium]|nr:LptF/LptG family permease [Gemmatimonadota bacterium]MCY3610731.1 LptF/LptG family permease [Gemmatimonadota bacterium]
MTILTRYLIRSHLVPLLFTFSLVTGLLYLNTVTRLLEDLVGKGLPTEIILEALILSFPHTLALSLPIAVLPAVLYTFSELASASEIVAMSASGVRPRKLFIPVLLLGTLLAGITYTFNDFVLPEANHRLKNLRNSIRQKSPTFQLRERVVNLIEGENGLGPYFLRVDEIDPVSAELTEVVIYDMSQQGVRRTTYATRGKMDLNSTFTDLHLRLHDGQVYEVGNREIGAFQRTGFEEQLYVLRGVGDVFQDMSGDQRTDREMSIAFLRDSAQAKRLALDSIRQDARRQTIRAVERALGTGPAADSAQGDNLVLAKSLQGAQGDLIPSDDFSRTVALTARTHTARTAALRKRASQYGVEIHKKLVIASACIIFVLIGMPVGIRFPRGGISMVIVVSATVIGVYQYGLTTGEDWADRDLAAPFWTMWAPNLVFLAIGSLMVSRMGRWIASSRDSGWRDLWLAARRSVQAVFRRGRRPA